MADKAIRGISPILRDILKSSNVTKEINIKKQRLLMELEMLKNG